MGVVAVVGLIITAYGAISQQQASKKAAKAQSRARAEQAKANALAQKREELEATRRKRELIRQTLRLRARTRARISASGISAGSSSAQGALAMVDSQGNAAVGGIETALAFGRQIGGFRTQANLFTSQAAKAQSSANTFAGISSFGSSMFSSSAQITNLAADIGVS